jgi:hypothetical protein
MSIILFLVQLCFANYPEVGNFVQYEAPFEGDKVIWIKKVISYDQARDTYLVGNRITYKDRVLEEVVYDQPRYWLYNPEKIKHVIDTCEEREGAITDLVVDNKQLRVCEMYDEESMLTYMIGPVPFGQVRFQIYLEGEEFLDFHLTKFKE